MPGPEANIHLKVSGLAQGATSLRLTHYRIDETHSNAFAEWNRMGSPVAPDEKQYGRLERAGQLATTAPGFASPLNNGQTTLTPTLPRQAVSLLLLEQP